MGRGFGDYARDFIRNWRESDDPLHVKIGKTIKNRAIAATWIRGGCCGHHGDPGC